MKLSGNRPFLLLVALFAALTLIVAGCGGDDGDSEATTTVAAETEATTPAAEGAGDEDAAAAQGGEPLADEDFVAAVVEVCESVQSASDEAGLDEPVSVDEDAGPEAFATELVARFDKVNEIFTQAFAELREITPPAASSDDYEEFLSTNDRLLALTKQTIDKFADDPTFTISEDDMKQQQKLGSKHERLLRKLGLPQDCFDSAPS